MTHDATRFPLRGGSVLAGRRRRRLAHCPDGGRPAGVLRAVGGRRRRRGGRRRLGSVLREHDRDHRPGASTVIGAPCNCRPPAWPGCSSRCSASSPWRIALYAPRYHPPRAERACTWPLTTWRCSPASASWPRVDGHLPGRLGVDEPALLSADSAAPAQDARRPAARSGSWPVRGRVPPGRGRVRDPVVARRFTRPSSSRHRRPRPPGRRRWRDAAYLLALAGLRVQGLPGPAARLAARGPPGRPGRRVGVPLRRGRQAGRVRHRPVRVPAAARLARPGPAW